MDTSAFKNNLKNYAKKLSKTISVDEMIVYGSYMRGEATTDSDIDVIIVSKDFDNMDSEKRYDLVYKAAKKLEPEIHPWPLTYQELKKADRQHVFGHARDHGIYIKTN